MRREMISLGLLLLCLAATSCYASDPTVKSDEITLKKSDNSVKVMVGDQLFTEYVTKSKSKPILWPINAADGSPVTRAPQDDIKEHPHHRSFWFSHGDVNGIDFWSEGPKAGSIEHDSFEEVTDGKGGKPARIVTKNSWKSPKGKTILTDKRELEFGASGTQRWIDFRITLNASEDKVVFGDTKEGSFAIRIAESMNVTSPGQGHLFNNRGLADGKAWGKKAEWVDYWGPIDGGKGQRPIVGIAIFNHPESFRFPTFWHVRVYGLFAANPFGEDGFKGIKGDTGAKGTGAYVLEKDKSLVLRYRVLIHNGEGKEERLNAYYEKYKNEK